MQKDGPRTNAFRLALVFLILAVPFLAGAQTVSAEPKAITQAKGEADALVARLYTLNSQAELLVEKYNLAQSQLAQTRTDLAKNQASLTQAEQALAQAEATLNDRLVRIYKQGDASITLDVILGASSWSDLTNRLSLLARISKVDRQVVDQVSASRKQVADRQTTLAGQLKKEKASEVQVLAVHKAVVAKLAENQSLLKGQTGQIAAMEKQWQAEQARLAAEARAAALQAKGRKVVQMAMKFEGVPYVWGGASPSGFDCSGLVMYVCGQLGVSLPHFAAYQYNYGTHLSRDQLQPGDLVFYGSPIHHVGIYVGNGNMIDAPYPGVSVRIDPLDSDYAGATRIF